MNICEYFAKQTEITLTILYISVKDKGLDVSESDSDDSDSSEEDEVLDPSFDQDFLKTLASLKSKDPSIYDKNIKFFKNEESGEESDDENDENKVNKTKDKKSKPVTLKDYERKIILEKGGKFVDGNYRNCLNLSKSHLK